MDDNTANNSEVPKIYANPKFYIKGTNKNGGMGFLAILGPDNFRVFPFPMKPVTVFETYVEANNEILKSRLNFNQQGTNFEVLDTNEVVALNTLVKPYDTIYYIKNQANRRLAKDSERGVHFVARNEDYAMWNDLEIIKQDLPQYQKQFKVMQLSIGEIAPLEPLERGDISESATDGANTEQKEETP
jgi:hypothetical protein